MSRYAIPDYDEVELPDPVCRYCGCAIEEVDQDCVALDEGVCSP